MTKGVGFEMHVGAAVSLTEIPGPPFVDRTESWAPFERNTNVFFSITITIKSLLKLESDPV